MTSLSERRARAIGIVSFGVGVLGLAAFLDYAAGNFSGHGGLSPAEAALPYGLVVCGGLFDVAINRLRALPGGLAIYTGAAGVVATVHLDQIGVLRAYERWIGAGMPEPNPNARQEILQVGSLALAGMLAVVVIWLAAAARLKERSNSHPEPDRKKS